MRDPRRTSGGLTLAVLFALCRAAGCAAVAGGAGDPRLPDQRLVTPVNDLPGPYTRVHPWGERPMTPATTTRGPRSSGRPRPERAHLRAHPVPPELLRRPTGAAGARLRRRGTRVGAWGAACSPFHHLIVDREGHVWTADEGNHAVRKFTADGRLLMTIGEPGTSGGLPRLLTRPRVSPSRPTAACSSPRATTSPTAPVARVTVDADGRFIKTWGGPGRPR